MNGDSGADGGHHTASVSTLHDRILYVLQTTGWSQREWGRRSGLAEQFIGSLLTRLKADPNADVGLVALRALAKSSGVSLCWLVGVDSDPGRLDARQSALDAAVVVARMSGLPESAIQAVVREPRQSDVTPLDHLDSMRAKAILG